MSETEIKRKGGEEKRRERMRREEGMREEKRRGVEGREVRMRQEKWERGKRSANERKGRMSLKMRRKDKESKQVKTFLHQLNHNVIGENENGFSRLTMSSLPLYLFACSFILLHLLLNDGYNPQNELDSF